jgi:hypothetical protein
MEWKMAKIWLNRKGKCCGKSVSATDEDWSDRAARISIHQSMREKDFHH